MGDGANTFVVSRTTPPTLETDATVASTTAGIQAGIVFASNSVSTTVIKGSVVRLADPATADETQFDITPHRFVQVSIAH